MQDLNDQTPLLRRYVNPRGQWIRRGFYLGVIFTSLLFWLASFFV